MRLFELFIDQKFLPAIRKNEDMKSISPPPYRSVNPAVNIIKNAEK